MHVSSIPVSLSIERGGVAVPTFLYGTALSRPDVRRMARRHGRSIPQVAFRAALQRSGRGFVAEDVFEDLGIEEEEAPAVENLDRSTVEAF